MVALELSLSTLLEGILVAGFWMLVLGRWIWNAAKRWSVRMGERKLRK